MIFGTPNPGMSIKPLHLMLPRLILCFFAEKKNKRKSVSLMNELNEVVEWVDRVEMWNMIYHVAVG